MENSIDGFLSNDSTGSFERALGNMFHGFNHSNVKPYLENDTGTKEKVYIVRPQLNMSATNLRNDRTLTNLITKESDNIQSYIRHTLDPRLMFSNSKYDQKNTPSFMDSLNPFIVLLSNANRTVAGFPDRTLPRYLSKPGVRGEQISAPDGVFKTYGVYELDMVFDKIKGNPVDKLLMVWSLYMGLSVEGMVSPYMKEDIDRTTNFDSRIYRINLDTTDTFVTGIASMGKLFPIVDNIGKEFDRERDRVRDKGTTTSFKFSASDPEYDDPILYKEFNETTAQFNPDIRNMLNGEAHSLFKLERGIKEKYNFTGYPIINLDTMELEYWISKYSNTYTKIVKEFNL